MIQITKNKEPKSWCEHRQTPGAKYEPTEDLRKSLLEEQGYICAYCMRRIPTKDSNSNETTRIEHIVPQATGIMDMDYSNMVVCCPGAIDGDFHCDKKKEMQTISFSLFDANFIKTLSYKSGTGEIISTNPLFNQQINEVLNLNHPKLQRNRKEVLQGLISTLGKRSQWRKSEIVKTRDYFATKHNGKFSPYCGIAVWFLNKKLDRLIAN